MTSNGDQNDQQPDQLAELDIDELVEQLTPEEIQRLLDDCDPDDPQIPSSLRTSYKCEKNPAGTLDRKKLKDFIYDQAMNTPDIPDVVPFVAGTVRGKKWQAPLQKGADKNLGGKSDIDLGLGEECEKALSSASPEEIVDLAEILGLHSVMNQEQFHSAQSDKWAEKADPNLGWNGITKATPLKKYPTQEPNRTNADEVINKLKSGDTSLEKINLNNIPLSDAFLMDLFGAIRQNPVVKDLSLANCTMGDVAANNLALTLKSNKCLEKLNLESNHINPHTLIKIFEV